MIQCIYIRTFKKGTRISWYPRPSLPECRWSLSDFNWGDTLEWRFSLHKTNGMSYSRQLLEVRCPRAYISSGGAQRRLARRSLQRSINRSYRLEPFDYTAYKLTNQIICTRSNFTQLLHVPVAYPTRLLINLIGIKFWVWHCDRERTAGQLLRGAMI